MQSQTEGRLGRTSAWEQTQGHATLPGNNVSPQSCFASSFPYQLLHRPKSGVLLSSPLVFAFHCHRASANILLLWDRGLRRAFPRRRLSPALIRPSAVPPPPAYSLTSRCCGFSGPLCRLLSEADWRPFLCAVLSGRAASGEAGMRVCRASAGRGAACLRESYLVNRKHILLFGTNVASAALF